MTRTLNSCITKAFYDATISGSGIPLSKLKFKIGTLSADIPIENANTSNITDLTGFLVDVEVTNTVNESELTSTVEVHGVNSDNTFPLIATNKVLIIYDGNTSNTIVGYSRLDTQGVLLRLGYKYTITLLSHKKYIRAPSEDIQVSIDYPTSSSSITAGIVIDCIQGSFTGNPYQLNAFYTPECVSVGTNQRTYTVMLDSIIRTEKPNETIVKVPKDILLTLYQFTNLRIGDAEVNIEVSIKDILQFFNTPIFRFDRITLNNDPAVILLFNKEMALYSQDSINFTLKLKGTS
jgi:hypothetical protein